MNSEANYIEVVGAAEYPEEIEKYVVELRLSARAAAGEVAMSDVSNMRAQLIQRLTESGLKSDELIEGGTAAWAPWFWKKKVGQEAVHKIIVKCDQLGRMMKALDSLESLFTDYRHTLSVEMQAPEFKRDGATIETARKNALRVARRKAELIATEVGVSLGMALQIEELGGRTRRSGMFGDEYWRGDVAVAAGGAAAVGGGDYPELSRANRETTIEFRVRYEIAGK